MDALALLQYFCTLIFFGLAGYFLPPFLQMPEWATRAAQVAWVILCLLSLVAAIDAGEPRKPVGRLSPIPAPSTTIIR